MQFHSHCFCYILYLGYVPVTHNEMNEMTNIISVGLVPNTELKAKIPKYGIGTNFLNSNSILSKILQIVPF